jgi:hypothetical protein
LGNDLGDAYTSTQAGTHSPTHQSAITKEAKVMKASKTFPVSLLPIYMVNFIGALGSLVFLMSLKLKRRNTK